MACLKWLDRVFYVQQYNKEKIEEILTNKTNIIEIDNWLGGMDEARQKG